jgi:hypothetical protein
VALTLAQALIALKGHARALIAWATGIVGFVVVTAVAGNDLFLRVEIGFLAAAGMTAVAMGWLLILQLRRGISVDSLATLVEQIEHEPLEI